MHPILEILFKIAPVVGVMGLWIFFQQRQINADKKIIAQQNAEYKELLERVITVSSKLLDASVQSPSLIKTEIRSLKDFIELKIAELKNEN